MTDQIRHTDRQPVSNLFLFPFDWRFLRCFRFLFFCVGNSCLSKCIGREWWQCANPFFCIINTNKIRSADAVSDVSVEQVDGTDVLVLNGYFESDDYELLIYYEMGQSEKRFVKSVWNGICLKEKRLLRRKVWRSKRKTIQLLFRLRR